MGLVLGGKMEETLKQSLIIFGDDVSLFATRPIAMTLLGITAMGLLWPLASRLWRLRVTQR
jgi:putative tricarboxylic transport membrane protein